MEQDLSKVKYVGAATLVNLTEAGITSVDQLAALSIAELEAIPGIGAKNAPAMIASAQALLNPPAASEPEQPVETIADASPEADVETVGETATDAPPSADNIPAVDVVEEQEKLTKQQKKAAKKAKKAEKKAAKKAKKLEKEAKKAARKAEKKAAKKAKKAAKKSSLASNDLP